MLEITFTAEGIFSVTLREILPGVFSVTAKRFSYRWGWEGIYACNFGSRFEAVDVAASIVIGSVQ